jgi:GGDEF domain-containing protein
VEWPPWLPFVAVACGLAFLLHAVRTRHLARERCRLDDELKSTSAKLRHSRKQQTLERDENRLLRLFLIQPTARRLADVLLRHLVHRPQRGFAAVIQWVGDEQLLTLSRGMGEDSRRQFRLPAALVERLASQPLLRLEDQALYDSGLLERLSPRDRGKAERLMIVADVEDGQPICALVTTRWFRGTVESQRHDDLASRLIHAIGQGLLKERDFEIQNSQLRLTADMLQLRSIADRTLESPTTMIQEYLSCLMHLLRSDRMAFFLSADSLVAEASVVRCGEDLPPGIAARWAGHEERLVDACRYRPTIVSFSSAELRRAGVQSLIGSALVIPLVKDGRTIAHVCCTRRRREPFSASQRDLADWAAGDFTHAMHRLLNHIATARQARIDGLTELANRRVFDQRIEREWERSRATGEPCSLLLLDLDRFKDVNDTYGHQAGDMVLRKISQMLRDWFQNVGRDPGLMSRGGPVQGRDPRWMSRGGPIQGRNDEVLLARYGGEELAILLPGMPEEGAVRIAETLRAAVEQCDFTFQTVPIAITASIGVATCPDHAKSVAGLISAADSALYFAKQSGRNRVRSASQAPEVTDFRHLDEAPDAEFATATSPGSEAHRNPPPES